MISPPPCLAPSLPFSLLPSPLLPLISAFLLATAPIAAAAAAAVEGSQQGLTGWQGGGPEGPYLAVLVGGTSLHTTLGKNCLGVCARVLKKQKGGQCGNVVKMGISHPTPIRQVYLLMCNSEITDIIAKQLGSIGGLAGSGWTKCLGG
eukprot:1160983-Pelagomonas_calceolata.AAC.13